MRNILAWWNDLCFNKSLSLADFIMMTTVVSLCSHDSLWWFLIIIPWIPISYYLNQRFSIKED